MSLGKCKLCDKHEELQNSHAIGNSVFKKILSRSNGNAIKISLNQDKIIRTNDSWATKQLCRDCEALFNNRFENYSYAALRLKRPDIVLKKFTNGISFNGINQRTLILYFLSIYWRGANSNHSSYKELQISNEINNYLKSLFINSGKIDHKAVNVRVGILKDNANHLSQETLTGILSTPFLRIDKKSLSFCFIIEGYFVEIFFMFMSYKKRSRKGFLDEKSTILFLPYIHILDIPELKTALAHAVYLDRNAKPQ